MRPTADGIAERRPRRFLIDDFPRPTASFPRRELAAGFAAAAISAQLVLAPVTLLIAAVLTLAGRISRWRPAWLLLPGVAGACWLAVVTLPVAVAALEAGSGRIAAAELAVALHPARLLHPSHLLAPPGLLHPAGRVGAGRVGAGQVRAAATASAGWWLPRELPLALLAGSAEAAVMLWLGWRRSLPAWRPGAIAVVRRRAAVAALAASRTVTASGCAIGLDPSSGRRAGFSWAEAQRGVMLAGPEERQLGEVGLGVVCAAMRLRKTVIVIDLSSGGPAGPNDPAPQVAVLARRLGVPVAQISALDGDVAPRMGRAIRSRRVVIVAGASQPEPASQAVGDLAGVLAGLRNLGLRGDCLAWVSSCDRVDLQSVADLVELGPATGTSILISTSSRTCAASLAARVGTTIECGRISAELASRLVGRDVDALSMGRHIASAAPSWAADANSRPMAASSRRAVRRSSYDILRTQRPGEFTLVSARHPDAPPISGLLVPIALGHVR